jgi:hypothetical protein
MGTRRDQPVSHFFLLHRLSRQYVLMETRGEPAGKYPRSTDLIADKNMLKVGLALANLLPTIPKLYSI